MRNIGLWCIILILSGCLVRTYTVEKPRVDLDVTGNRGYLVGTPAEEGAPPSQKTRKTTVVEVEFGSHRPRKGRVEKEVSPRHTPREGISVPLMEEEEFLQEEVSFEEGKNADSGYTLYTVQKNDTLQKIAQKFYGTTKKYMMLYEENKNVLKGPDRIYPGMKIRIPSLD